MSETSFDSACWLERQCFPFVSWWAFIFNQKFPHCFSDVHWSFPCLVPVSLEMCPFWNVVTNGETHEEKINHQLWDYIGYMCRSYVAFHSLLNFQPSITENEIQLMVYMSWPQRSLHTLLVCELDLARDALSVKVWPGTVPERTMFSFVWRTFFNCKNLQWFHGC